MVASEQQHDETSHSQVRVVVALGINPYSQRLLKTAARLAHGLDGHLLVLHITPPGHPANLYQANLQWHMQQAEELGGRVEIVEGRDVAETLVHYAVQQGATHLVVGQSDVSRWREVTRGSVINRLQRLIFQRGARIDLYIVTSSSRV